MTLLLPHSQTDHSGPATAQAGVQRGGQPWKGLLRALGILAAASPLLATAACTTSSDVGFATLNNEVPVTQAAIVPAPGGPSIVTVLQRKYQNGVSQEIALSTASRTPGQNAFYVSLATGSRAQSEIDDVLSVPALRQDRIQEEMEERIPGVEMQTSLVYVQNKYGPFGFATGRSARGDLCLYAWQRIEPNEPAIFLPGGTISVRLRLCDAGATTQQLLQAMYGFTISAHLKSNFWNPYGSPPPAPAQLGEIDAPLYPLGLDGSANQAPARRQGVRVRTNAVRSLETGSRIIDKDTVAPASPPATPDVPAGPASGYPVVPPPASQ